MGRPDDDRGLSLFDDDPEQGEPTHGSGATTALADPEPAEDAPTRRRVSPRKVALILGSALLVLVLIVVLVIGFYLSRVNRAISQIPREDLMPAPTAPAPPPPPGPQPINYVLLGTDTAPGDAGRSDSLIVAHVPANRSKVYLISFPRDLWVDIPGHGKGKINWAYAFGGPKLTVQTLQQLLDVPIDHTAVVDFNGFIALTEALGGVEVYNDRAFNAGNFHFDEGWVTLRGDQALAYVRERKSLPNGDLDRAAHQRAVVNAILEKATKPETLANPMAVDRLLGDASKVVKVDRELTDDKIRKTATSMQVRRSSDLVSTQSPIVGFGWAGDQAIAVIDEKQTAELATALREDRFDDYLQRFPKTCTGPEC